MFFSEKKNLGIFFTCGRKIWGAGACAAHYENVCDVRAGADENPKTLKVWHFEMWTKIENHVEFV